MIGQRVLLACAIGAGAIAGILYYVGSQRLPVVVVAHDVDYPRPLTADDLELRALPPDTLPDGAVTRLEEALGRVPISPLWRGQTLVARGLAGDTASFHTGLVTPAGFRAIALPMSAAGAVGGAIAPGARVDVLAVPVLGRAPAGRTTELLATAVLVLDVRTESGTPVLSTASARPPSGQLERVGSVVVAIQPADEIRFADRIATSTFVLAFVSSR